MDERIIVCELFNLFLRKTNYVSCILKRTDWADDCLFDIIAAIMCAGYPHVLGIHLTVYIMNIP